MSAYIDVSSLTEKEIIENLLTFYNCAREQQKKEGLTWYKSVNCLAQDWAREFNLPLENVCGVIAVLSPQNNWEQNVKDARAVLIAAKNGGTIEDFRVATYGLNKKKAFAMANGESPDDHVRGDKVSRFYGNILNAFCDDDKEATVDIWAARAAYGIFDQSTKLNLTDSQYAMVNKAYQNVAQMVGETPKALQAVVWVVVRDMSVGISDKIRTNHMMFCPNCLQSPHTFNTGDVK